MQSFSAQAWLASLALSVPLAAQTPRASQLVDVTTPSGDDVTSFDLASSGGVSVLVYTDDTFSGVGSGVYARSSDASGLNWSPPVRVDQDATGALKLGGYQNNTHGVALVGNTVYTVWIDERDGFTDADLYLGISQDGGVTWSERRIDKGLPGGAFNKVDSFAFAVSPDPAGDDLYIGMLLGVTGPDELYMAVSHDGGASFLPTIPMSTLNGVADVDEFSLAVEGDQVHVVFLDGRLGTVGLDDLWYRHSIDGGLTFGPEVQLDASGPALGDLVGPPMIVRRGDRVAVAWLEELGDPNNEEVHLRVSVDGGVSFLSDVLVSSPDATLVDADDVTLAICGSNVLVGWDDARLGGDASFLRITPDDGASFGPEIQASSPGTGNPRLTSDGSSLVVVSSESGIPNMVEVSWSSDCGASFVPYFTASGPDTLRADETLPILDDTLSNVLLLWASEEAGDYNAYVGGFSLCVGVPVTTRNGGTNPMSLTASEARLGEVFSASVDVGSTGHALAGLVGFATPAFLTLSGGRVLLVNTLDPSGELLGFLAQAGPLATFTALVPNDPGLCGFEIATQAVHFGGSPFQLSNAQDLTVSGI